MNSATLLLLLAIAFAGALAQAQDHKGMALQTFIKSPSGSPVQAKNLTVKVNIVSPNNCALMEEIHNGVDVSDGYMSITIGQGSRSAVDRSLTMREVFSNHVTRTGLDNVDTGANCTFTPSSNTQDIRRARLSFAIGNDPIQVEFDLRSVPYAVQAEEATTLQGLKPADLVKVNNSKNLSQAKLEEFFDFITSHTGKPVAFDGSNFVEATMSASVDPSTFPSNSISGNAVSSLPYSKITGVPAALNQIADANCANGKMLMMVGGSWSCVDQPTTDWNSLSGKPATFAPTAHGHYYSDLLSQNGVYMSYKPNDVACSDGQVLKWSSMNSGWICGNDSEGTSSSSSGGTVTSIAGGTGLLGGTITTSGTLSVDAGTNPGQIIQVGSDGKLPTVDGSKLTNVIATTVTGTVNANQIVGNILASQVTGLGTAAYLNAGTSANNAVQLDSNAKLPAVDGSQLTNITATSFNGTILVSQVSGLGNSATLNVGNTSNTVAAGNDPRFPSASCASGNKMRWNGTAWLCETDMVGTNSGGTVTSITAGTGLLGGTITSSGTVSVDVGTTAGKIVQLDSNGKLPAIDGSQLTNVTATSISGTVPFSQISGTLATTQLPIVPINKGGTGLTSGGSANQVLGMNASGSAMEYKAITAGSGISVTYSSGAITVASTNNGTVTSVSATSPLQVSNSSTTPSLSLASGSQAGQTLRWNGLGWAASKLLFTDLTNSLGTSAFSIGACASGSFLGYSSVTDSFSCSSVAFSQVSGTVATTQLPTVPVAKGGTGLAGAGSANQVLGMNSAGNAMEYKSLTAGANVTITNTAGSVTVSANMGRTSCPSGFTLIGTPGDSKSFCIQNAKESSSTWINAVQTCKSKGSGAHLCSLNEWVTACVDNSSLVTDGAQWLLEVAGHPTPLPVAATGSACDSFSAAASTAVQNSFRCCY